MGDPVSYNTYVVTFGKKVVIGNYWTNTAGQTSFVYNFLHEVPLFVERITALFCLLERRICEMGN